MIIGFDLPELIRTIGYIGLFSIVFVETGLLIGFFLPGDSLLFTAGILAGQGYMNIYLVMAVMTTAAILGDNVAYAIGKKLGPKIFTKEESLFFNKKYIAKTQSYFDKYGAITIVIARFVPVMRAFAPTLAGVGKMGYPKFLFYNISGAFFWIMSVTLLGYYFGLKVTEAEKYIVPGIILILFLCISPLLKKFIYEPNIRAQCWDYLKRIKN